MPEMHFSRATRSSWKGHMIESARLRHGLIRLTAPTGMRYEELEKRATPQSHVHACPRCSAVAYSHNLMWIPTVTPACTPEFRPTCMHHHLCMQFHLPVTRACTHRKTSNPTAYAITHVWIPPIPPAPFACFPAVSTCAPASCVGAHARHCRTPPIVLSSSVTQRRSVLLLNLCLRACT